MDATGAKRSTDKLTYKIAPDHPLASLAAIDHSDISILFAKCRAIAEIDRAIVCDKEILVPVQGSDAQAGAAIFIATLLYPESEDSADKFVEAIQAMIYKSIAPPRSDFRKQMRDAGLGNLIDLPNKRIEQRLSRAIKRFHIRMRAAWVIFQKLASSNDPNKQNALEGIMAQAVAQCTRAYPPFGDVEKNYDDAIDSFRHQVMNSSRNVIHLAMAMHLYVEGLRVKPVGLPAMVQAADLWLKPVVIAGEMFRLSFGDLFPSRDTQYSSKRQKNFVLPLEKSISVLPDI